MDEKKCEMCGKLFMPYRPIQKYCSECKPIADKERKREWEKKKHPNRRIKCTDPCCICGGTFSCKFDGKPYCNKHWLRMYINGTIEPKIRAKTTTLVRIDDTTSKIVTKKGEEIIIDSADEEKLMKYSWCISKTGYPVATVDHKVVKLHRYLLDIIYTDKIADHKNGNPLDNRRCNLRVCTLKQNARNSGLNKNNSSGHTGISQKANGKYRARIMVNRKEICLGTFDSFDEAVEAREQAEIKYFEEFAPCIRKEVANGVSGVQ